MKTPRDVSGPELIKALWVFGYAAIRQASYHIRLTTTVDGEFHLSIPNYSPLRIGTFKAILKVVAEHHHLTVEELLGKLRL